MRILLPFVIATLSLPAQLGAAEVVPVPKFDSIELVGGGDVDIVPGPVQRVTIVSGSSAYTRIAMEHDGRLRIDACNARCPRNYPLHIRIETPRVPAVGIRAGGRIIAAPGFARMNEVSAAVDAGGTIDLRALPVDHVSAAVNAGGDIYVRPRASLAAAVSAGGDIHYSGNPQVSMAVHNGGDVRRDD